MIWNDDTTKSKWSGFSMVIDTDSYAGNFERELLSACTGISPEYPTQDSREERLKYDGPSMMEVVGYVLYDLGSNPYHDRCVIFPNPDWGSDGNGEYYRVTPDRPAVEHAYFSVRIPLYCSLEPEELYGIRRRALDFAARKGFTITRFRYIEDRIETRSMTV